MRHVVYFAVGLLMCSVVLSALALVVWMANIFGIEPAYGFIAVPCLFAIYAFGRGAALIYTAHKEPTQ